MVRMLSVIAFLLACPRAHAERGVYAGASLDFHFVPDAMQVRNGFAPGFGGRIGARLGPLAVDGWLSMAPSVNATADSLHARGVDLKLHAPVHANISLYGRARWVHVDASITPLFDGEAQAYRATGRGAALGVQVHGKSPILALIFPWLTGTGLPIVARRGAVFLELTYDHLRRPDAYFHARDQRPTFDRHVTLRLGWTWGSAS